MLVQTIFYIKPIKGPDVDGRKSKLEIHKKETMHANLRVYARLCISHGQNHTPCLFALMNMQDEFFFFKLGRKIYRAISMPMVILYKICKVRNPKD